MPTAISRLPPDQNLGGGDDGGDGGDEGDDAEVTAGPVWVLSQVVAAGGTAKTKHAGDFHHPVRRKG